MLALAQIPPVTVGSDYTLVYDASTEGSFSGTAQMIGGAIPAIGRIDTTEPSITDPGFRITTSGVGTQLSFSAGERLYARAYQGTAVIQLVRSAGDGAACVPIGINHPSSPFADIAARDAYFTTNPTELRNSNTPDESGSDAGACTYTRIVVTGNNTPYRWNGPDQPSSYDAGGWTVITSDGLTPEEMAALTTVVNAPAGELLMGTSAGIAGTGATVSVVDGLNRYTLNGEIDVPSGGGLRFGQNDIGGGGNQFGGASSLRVANSVNSTQGYLCSTDLTASGSSRPYCVDFGPERNDGSPANKTETFVGSPGHRFSFVQPRPIPGTKGASGIVTQYVVTNASQTETFTGCDFTLWENGFDQDVLFSFSGSNPRPVKTFTMAPGDNTVETPEPIGFPPTGIRIYAEIICSSGNVELAGQTIPFLTDPLDPSSTATENVEFPYLEFRRHFSTRLELEAYLGSPSLFGFLASDSNDNREWFEIIAGTGLTLTRNDAANTITLSRTANGGGTNPPATTENIYFGLSNLNNPADVDISTLTHDPDVRNPDTIQTGLTTGGQYFILLVQQNTGGADSDDLTRIMDTVLGQDVTNLFTRTENVRTIGGDSFNSYVIGPLNAGINETYEVHF